MSSDLDYDEGYFIERVGGAEFFRLYGARIVKPAAAYALKKAALAPGLRALDVGCGRGELLYQLREAGATAVGVDLAPAALRLSAKTARAPVLRCEASRLPFATGTFDRVFFLGVLDHLSDDELSRCFSEFRRVLRPRGFVLANTCANTEYYKRWTYAARRRLAALLRLQQPRPPKSEEDERLHINEHEQRGLERFFARLGWTAEVEARPNEKYCVEELYGRDRPADFPLRPAPAWRKVSLQLAFAGPWKRYFAREFFCKITPKHRGEMGKKNRTRPERRPEQDQAQAEPISASGWRIIGGGIALLIAGFIVLTRVDALGRNWAAIVSPLLILGGYGIIALGIFWTPEEDVPAPNPPSSGPTQTI